MPENKRLFFESTGKLHEATALKCNDEHWRVAAIVCRGSAVRYPKPPAYPPAQGSQILSRTTCRESTSADAPINNLACGGRNTKSNEK